MDDLIFFSRLIFLTGLTTLALAIVLTWIRIRRLPREYRRAFPVAVGVVLGAYAVGAGLIWALWAWA